MTTAFDRLPQSIRNQMCAAMEIIASPFDHIRVDCFVDAGVIWFNELASYHRSGLAKMEPELERARGARWVLPDLRSPDPREAEWRGLLGPLPRGSIQ